MRVTPTYINTVYTMKSIWITWEVQRRNQELSKAMDIPFFEFSQLHSMSRWLKYPYGILLTICILVKERPQVVFCQNPSIVLSFFMTLIGLITPIKVIVDAHYAGIKPGNKILQRICDFICRHADMVIVTNKMHKMHVDICGGHGAILQDKLPTVSNDFGGLYESPKGNVFLLICSYADDEPWEMVTAVFEHLPKDYHLMISGNYNKAGINPDDYGENIHFLGFVDTPVFDTLLHEVDGVIDLTLRDDCLVCGAYEAIAAETPLILSNTRALTEYFAGAAIFTHNTPNSLKNAIDSVITLKPYWTERVKKFKQAIEIDWEIKKDRVLEYAGIK